MSDLRIVFFRAWLLFNPRVDQIDIVHVWKFEIFFRIFIIIIIEVTIIVCQRLVALDSQAAQSERNEGPQCWSGGSDH